MMRSKVKWVRLGDYIEARNERNTDLRYGVELIEGVNSDGEFQSTKAATDGIDMKPYRAVYEGDIVYNPSRLNIGSLAFREDGLGMCIVSHLYQVFHVKDKFQDTLLPEYLLLYFKRNEFSRTVDYYNYGSQRAEFNLQKLGELNIPLPPIEEQRKIVDVWKGLNKDKEEFKKLGITFEEKAFFDILTDLRDKHKFEYADERCITLAKKIKELIDGTSLYADWLNNDNLKSQLASDLTFLIYKEGYPPQWDEEVFRRVLEQVENYKKHN